MSLLQSIRKLCTPALIYLLLSLIAMVYIVGQNYSQRGELCIGPYSCPSSNTGKMFVLSIEVIYVLFWTWILTLICKSGYRSIAWAIVLFPFILMFIILGMIIYEGNQREMNQA